MATAFEGFVCHDCGERADDRDGHRCPACSSTLVADYDYGDASIPTSDTPGGMYRYDDLLPFSRDSAVTLEEGGTPLIDCPALAEDLGVGAVYVKDEGRNPSGAAVDRGLSVAVTAARERGADAVALPSTGNGAQSSAAYAARAGLDSEAFVPSRCPFVDKAMTNVHGGDMSVVEGRYPDALAAFEDARADADRVPVDPASPYRPEGAKTILHEIGAQLDAEPDAVVTPVGHGTLLTGLARAAEERTRLGLAADSPRLYAAQPTGCSPVVDAFDAGETTPRVPDHPDTICGALEVPDPACGAAALAGIERTGGDAVAVEDDRLLAAAVETAETTGLSPSATGGTAVAAARVLAAQGAFDGDETVVLVNPVAGNKENDLLRSHLMSRGV
ncbi:MAG: pyridoxal-phosphate dependent enzyme [Haloarculaceae archaeon]